MFPRRTIDKQFQLQLFLSDALICNLKNGLCLLKLYGKFLTSDISVETETQ